MPVTEFAVIQLCGGTNKSALAHTLTQCKEIQDGWARKHGILESEGHLSAMYLEKPGPSAILITAPWASVAEHFKWIETSENGSCNLLLKPFVSTESNPVLLQHLEAASTEVQLTEPFSAMDTFQVSRLLVDPAKRTSVQNAYQQLERELQQGTDVKDRQIWAGWRVEQRDEAEELVVFHAQNLPGSLLDPLAALAQNVERHSYACLPTEPSQ